MLRHDYDLCAAEAPGGPEFAAVQTHGAAAIGLLSSTNGSLTDWHRDDVSLFTRALPLLENRRAANDGLTR